MDMRKDTSYPMLVIEGSFLPGNIFWKTFQPTRGIWSNLASPYPQATSSQQRNFPCSMTCYWLISEIGRYIFS